MLFPQAYSFFLASSFQFTSRSTLPSTHFIYCLPCYPRSSTESLILLIWFCMYSVCSFRYTLDSSFCDTETNVHPLLVSWYFYIFAMKVSVFLYTYCVYVMIYRRRSGIWPILFEVLTLNVTICIVLLHFSNICFSLSSVADFFKTGARGPTSAGRALFFTHAKGDAIGICGLSMSHNNLSMAVFYFYPWQSP